MKNIVYLVRHGETNESQLGIVQGQKNSNLNKTGKETSARIGKYVNENINIKRIISSDLNRCIESAVIIMNELNYEVIYKEDRLLREISLGDFEGKPIKNLNEFREKTGDIYSATPKEGESINDLRNRIKEWINTNFNMINSSLIVTHKGPISVFLNQTISNLSDGTIVEALKQGIIIALELISDKRLKFIKLIKV